MKTKDMFDVYSQVSDRINGYWRFSVSVQVSVFGWLILLAQIGGSIPDEKIKILITIIYFIGIWMTPWALAREYNILSGCVEELKQAVNKEEEISTSFKNTIDTIEYSYRVFLIWVAHTGMAGVILFLIWSDMLWKTSLTNQ